MEELPFGNEFEGFVNSFSRRQAAQGWEKLKQQIQAMTAVGAEPFLRVGMGERHFGPKEKGASLLLWLLVLLLHSGFALFTHEAYAVIGAVIAAAVFVRFIHVLRQNEQELEAIRASKTPYHTRSPGKPRFASAKAENTAVITASVFFLLFAPIVGLAFVASVGASRMRAKELEQRIIDNYLDARDNEIESKFIKRALKGEIPAEITYLYAPLSPEKFDDQTREDISNAWVSGVPKSVARPPKPETPIQENVVPRPKTAYGEESVPGSVNPARPSASARATAAAAQHASGILKATINGVNYGVHALTSKKFLKFVASVAVLLAVVLLAITAYDKWQSLHHKSLVPTVEAGPLADAKNQVSGDPVPQPVPRLSPISGSQNVRAPAATSQHARTLKPQTVADNPQPTPVAVPLSNPTADVPATGVIEASASTAVKRSEYTEGPIANFRVALKAAVDELEPFAKECDKIIEGQNSRIARLPEGKQQRYIVRVDNFRSQITAMLRRQNEKLSLLKEQLLWNEDNKSLLEMQETMTQLKQERQDAKDGLLRLEMEIYNASVSR